MPRQSFLAFSISNHHEETTSSSNSQYFHHILIISIIFDSTIISIVSSSFLSFNCMHLSLQFHFQIPSWTVICISITLNDGAHCAHHIFQFQLFQSSLAVSSIILIPTTDLILKPQHLSIPSSSPSSLIDSMIITIFSDRFHQNHKTFQFPPALLSLPPLIDSIAINICSALHHHC